MNEAIHTPVAVTIYDQEDNDRAITDAGRACFILQGFLGVRVTMVHSDVAGTWVIGGHADSPSRFGLMECIAEHGLVQYEMDEFVLTARLA